MAAEKARKKLKMKPFYFGVFLYFETKTTLKGQLYAQKGTKTRHCFPCLQQQATSGDKLPSFESHLNFCSNFVCCDHVCVTPFVSFFAVRLGAAGTPMQYIITIIIDLIMPAQ